MQDTINIMVKGMAGPFHIKTSCSFDLPKVKEKEIKEEGFSLNRLLFLETETTKHLFMRGMNYAYKEAAHSLYKRYVSELLGEEFHM